MTLATKFMSDKRWRVELSPFESGDGVFRSSRMMAC